MGVGYIIVFGKFIEEVENVPSLPQPVNCILSLKEDPSIHSLHSFTTRRKTVDDEVPQRTGSLWVERENVSIATDHQVSSVRLHSFWALTQMVLLFTKIMEYL